MSAHATSWDFPWPSSNKVDRNFVLGIAFWLALIQVSIAASQIVLAVLIGVWAVRTLKGEAAFVRMPIDGPIALYAGLSLLAALFSFDPASSLQASKKLLLLLVPYMLASTVRRHSSIEALVLVLVAMADLGALVGLWQYRFGQLGDIDHRIRGFMSHYMTYSGLLMGIFVLALALLLFHRRAAVRTKVFLALSLTLIGAALVLSLTRSAWVGALVAAGVLVLIRDRRLLLVGASFAAAATLVLPRDVERRLESFLRPDTSSWDRVYMLESGVAMIRNHPGLGVGPNMVNESYSVYRMPDAPLRSNPHLHNNLMQIAAERGLACLVAWLWMLGVAFAAAVRVFRRVAGDSRARGLAAGGLAVMVAGLLAGLFEYNFGDSEFQMLFLFAMTMPWMIERDGGDEVPPLAG